jgi:hypothetical protein
MKTDTLTIPRHRDPLKPRHDFLDIYLDILC